jgi:hypothetical protein
MAEDRLDDQDGNCAELIVEVREQRTIFGEVSYTDLALMGINNIANFGIDIDESSRLGAI